MIYRRIFRSLTDGATLVTATRRLSRELTAQYDLQQINSGRKAWNSPDILPWEAWLRRCWEQVAGYHENPPLVLSEAQLLGVWHRIISDDIRQNEAETEPLWNTDSSARAAIKALRLIRGWQISCDPIAGSFHPDHRCFNRWLARFDSICLERQWIDSFQLADCVGAQVQWFPAAPVVLTGFNEVTPQQQSLIETIQSAEIELTIVDSALEVETQYNCSTFEDDLSQWLAAGQWARNQLALNPSHNIAIVAPDLAKSRDTIEYALKQTLCPREIVHPSDITTLPFHLSLGAILSRYPIAQETLKLLTTLCTRHAGIDLISNLVLSPFIHGSQSELGARSELDLELRQQLPFNSGLAKLIDQIHWLETKNQGIHCKQLNLLLHTAADMLSTAPSKASYTYWSGFFTNLLSAIGWPGAEPLGSEEHQVGEAVRIEINRLAELDLTNEEASIGIALNCLSRQIKSHIFQVEASSEPVQVMGIEETAGLEFDSVWFGGLVEPDWPPHTRPSPFIPISAQRAAEVVFATPESTALRARQQQQRLLQNSGEVVLSRHLFDNEIALEPSPLVSTLNQIVANHEDIPPTLARQYNEQRPQLEIVSELQGSAVDPNTHVVGGSSLIQTQARCPRGAFARFRLGVEPLDTNDQGLDPMERGTILHLALEQIWEQIKNSNRLQEMSQTELVTLVDHCIDHVSVRYKVSSGCGDGFFASQHRWLSATLLEWLDLEKKREEPFTVISREQKSSLNLAGLVLRFKIDRIDLFEDGTLVLIDYKSGGVNPLSEWVNQRPTAPQLPLYTIAQANLVSVVTFAQVRLGECQFVGVSNRESFGIDDHRFKITELSRHRTLGKAFQDWQHMQEFWLQSLSAVAAEFLAGDARIDPEGEGVCRFCETPAFCRSGDRLIEETE